MEKRYLSLDEKPERGFVRILMILFGALCLATSGWWAYYLLSAEGVQSSFWAATIFLALFGIYQVYAGLGYAARYLEIKDNTLIVKQLAILPRKVFIPEDIDYFKIGPTDIEIRLLSGKRFRLRLGIRYPERSEEVKRLVEDYANSFEKKVDFE